MKLSDTRPPLPGGRQVGHEPALCPSGQGQWDPVMH